MGKSKFCDTLSKDVFNIKLLINKKIPDIHHRNIENYEEILNTKDIVFVINSMNGMKIFNEAIQVRNSTLMEALRDTE